MRFHPRSLASRGLIEQIHEVKRNGYPGGIIHEKETGKSYRMYTYTKGMPQEKVIALIDVENSLPRVWYSYLIGAEPKAGLKKIIYRDMESNVEIPDSHFQVPGNMKWRK